MHAEDGVVLAISQAWTSLTGYSITDVPTFDAWLTRAYGEGADEVRKQMQDVSFRSGCEYTKEDANDYRRGCERR
jgi:hypothetical protein